MNSFDEALANAVPDGIGAPLAIAAGALLLHHFFGGSSAAPAAPAAPAPAPAPSGGGSFLDGGGLIGGLSGLVGKLTQAGAGSQVSSWVGNGANQPIDPSHLGQALGPDVLAQLAAKTGLSQEQLTQGLSTILPQLVNTLTPNGRLPTAQEAQYQGNYGR